jgi:hypothetical protein
MKTKSKKLKKTFDAVKSMREIRDKISLEIADMDFEQLKAYFSHRNITEKKQRLHKAK